MARLGWLFLAAALIGYACQKKDDPPAAAQNCYTGVPPSTAAGFIQDENCNALIEAAGGPYSYAGNMLGLNDEAFFTVRDTRTNQWANASFGWIYCRTETGEFAVGSHGLTGSICEDFFEYRIFKAATADDAFLTRGGGTLYGLWNVDVIGRCTLTITSRSAGSIAGSITCSNLPRPFGINFAGEAFGARIDSLDLKFSFTGIANDTLTAN